jgi:hypothetical protein
MTKPTDAELRAMHTCIKDMSSMNCRACNAGIPYPHQSIEELLGSMTTSRIKARFRGQSPHRYKDNPLERRFAELWQKANDGPNGGHTTLDYLMDPTNRGCPSPPLSDRDWQVANTVIQWLGSPVGQVFLREAISGKEGQYFRHELAAHKQLTEKFRGK